MNFAMGSAWIELVGRDGSRRRFELKRGLTVIGGAKSDVPADGVEGDQIHVWDQPPKAIFVGFGEPPTCAGARFEERELKSGDVLLWRGLRLEFGGLMSAMIEEVPLAPPLAPVQPRTVESGGRSTNPANAGAPAAASLGAAAGPAAMPGVDELYWRRLKAGMAVEIGAADASVARRWQDAVLRGEFDADACARDILNAAPGLTDVRLGERTTRLQRDLVMAPVAATARGSARKLKGAAQNMAAMVIAQFVVFSICLLLVMLALFVLRLRWDWSIDGFFDRLAGVFGA